MVLSCDTWDHDQARGWDLQNAIYMYHGILRGQELKDCLGEEHKNRH